MDLFERNQTYLAPRYESNMLTHDHGPFVVGKPITRAMSDLVWELASGFRPGSFLWGPCHGVLRVHAALEDNISSTS